MRVSYWVKYFNNNARCHPESRRRRGTSQPRLVTRRWIFGRDTNVFVRDP